MTSEAIYARAFREHPQAIGVSVKYLILDGPVARDGECVEWSTLIEYHGDALSDRIRAHEVAHVIYSHGHERHVLGDDVTESAIAAYEAEQRAAEAYTDPNAEHRLTGAQLGLERVAS